MNAARLASLLFSAALLLPAPAHAISLGTDAGFCATRPSTDPGGGTSLLSTRAIASKVTVPAGIVKIIEIGWYKVGASPDTGSANWEAGAYTHDSGNDRPGTLITGSSRTNSSGADAGAYWQYVTGLDIAVTAGETIWLAVQCDEATGTNNAYATVGGTRRSAWSAQTTLVDSWTNAGTANMLHAIYAIGEAGAGGATLPVFMNQYRQRRN